MSSQIPPRSLGSARIQSRYSAGTRRFLIPTQQYIHTESLGGIALMVAAALALFLANSPWHEAFLGFWHLPIQVDTGLFKLQSDRHHVVNDVFMTIFFLVVGLEIKREIARGELSNPRKAALPVVAALGGMVLPALIYVAFNYSSPQALRGWGVPMATDIAFSLGILALLGKRIPLEAKMFLLALAIADDIGAILVIAFFYSGQLNLYALVVAGVVYALILAFKRMEFSSFFPYVVLGAFFWMAVYTSGVHATIAGVILGLTAPARAYFSKETFEKEIRGLLDAYHQAKDKDNHVEAENVLGQLEEITRQTEAPLDRLVRTLHPWSNFFVLPIFALANAGVHISGEGIRAAFESPVTIGVILGLVAGKFVGIFGCSYAAVKFGWVEKPKMFSWPALSGVAMLAGVGFTVSLFIADLAFITPDLVDHAKIGILVGSALAGLAGYFYLKATLVKPHGTTL